MAIQKPVANKILANLDETANKIDMLAKAGKIDPRVAASLTLKIDSFADKLQVATFGPDALKRHTAKVLQRDPDEKYMDTYDNPNKVIQSDPDEPYMHKTPAGANSKAIDNYDQDQ